MWCDTFDADLLKVVPGAIEALGDTAAIGMRTYSHVTDGKINCPSAWNTHDGLVAFFWTADEHRLPSCYWTDEPVVPCTWLEVVRDEWVHGQVVSVDDRIVWRPPVRLFERLMYDLRGWTVLDDSVREGTRRDVLRSLEAAAGRLRSVLSGTGAVTG